MKLLELVLYFFLVAFVLIFLCGVGMFIISFIGLTFDNITGTHTYFNWAFS